MPIENLPPSSGSYPMTPMTSNTEGSEKVLKKLPVPANAEELMDQLLPYPSVLNEWVEEIMTSIDTNQIDLVKDLNVKAKVLTPFNRAQLFAACYRLAQFNQQEEAAKLFGRFMAELIVEVPEVADIDYNQPLAVQDLPEEFEKELKSRKYSTASESMDLSGTSRPRGLYKLAAGVGLAAITTILYYKFGLSLPSGMRSKTPGDSKYNFTTKNYTNDILDMEVNGNLDQGTVCANPANHIFSQPFYACIMKNNNATDRKIEKIVTNTVSDLNTTLSKEQPIILPQLDKLDKQAPDALNKQAQDAVKPAAPVSTQEICGLEDKQDNTTLSAASILPLTPETAMRFNAFKQYRNKFNEFSFDALMTVAKQKTEESLQVLQDYVKTFKSFYTIDQDKSGTILTATTPPKDDFHKQGTVQKKAKIQKKKPEDLAKEAAAAYKLSQKMAEEERVLISRFAGAKEKKQ